MFTWVGNFCDHIVVRIRLRNLRIIEMFLFANTVMFCFYHRRLVLIYIVLFTFTLTLLPTPTLTTILTLTLTLALTLASFAFILYYLY